MSCGKDGCKEIKGEVKEVKDGNKAEAKAEAKSQGMPWGLIMVLSLIVIGVLFLAEKRPIGEVLSPDTVAKINSIGHTDTTTTTADLKVVDKGDTVDLVNTKTGESETYQKEITIEFKAEPATEEQSKKIEKAVKEVAKAQTAKPAPKEVVKTGGLVRKEIPPLNK